MNRKVWVYLLCGIILTVVAGQAMAAESDGSGLSDKAYFFSVVAASCAFAMAIASAGCGIAQSKAIALAMESIGRQPSAYKDIQTLLIIGLALIESLALYTLVIALILIYASPFTDLIVH
jgi:F-type H+-transporting ATPase subunit c